MAKKLSILDKTFQLALLLHRRTAEFNRKYKFTIGDRIDVVAEEAQEMILRANHQTDPKRAAQIIYDFVLRIDTLSLKLRMAVALGLMSDDAKAQCDMLIAKIKDEARGWRNYFLRGEGVVGKNNEPSAESLYIIILKRGLRTVIRSYTGNANYWRVQFQQRGRLQRQHGQHEQQQQV